MCNYTQLGVRACCLGPRVSDFSVGLSVCDFLHVRADKFR